MKIVNKQPSVSSINEVKVDILVDKEFTSTHLKTTETLFSGIQKEAYSSYFYPQGGRFIGWKLEKVDNIKDYMPNGLKTAGHIQVARVFSGNPKEQDIRNNILNNKWKLKCLPIQGQLLPDGTIRIINGRTRLKFLKEQGVKNVIISLFEFDNTSDYLAETIRQNMDNDPAGNAKMQDVIATGQTVVQSGLIVREGNDNFKQDVYDWVNRACVDGIFTPQTIDQIATTIYNHYDKRNFIAQWDIAEVTKWMNNHGYKKVYKGNTTIFENTKDEKDDYLYYVVSYTASMKNIVNAAVILNKEENENKKLRIIVHTGILPASITTKSDLVTKFNDHVEKHNDKFNNYMNIMREVFYVSEPLMASSVKLSKRVSCYGALPTITGKHDMDNFVLV